MNERSLHVVLGTGPLGLAVGRHLAARCEPRIEVVESTSPRTLRSWARTSPTRLMPNEHAKAQWSSTNAPTLLREVLARARQRPSWGSLAFEGSSSCPGA
jgi:hypothetical protein